jgi:hypothetical protein
MFAVAPPTSLADGWTLLLDEVRHVGGDLRITARPSRVAGA